MDAAVELHVDAAGHGRRAERHVLVVRLERGGAAREEARVPDLRGLVRPVVLELVVVEDHEPRGGGVRVLQVRVRLVLRHAGPVLGEGAGLPVPVGARDPRGDRVPVRHDLVVVVPQVDHEVGTLGGHVAVGGEVAVLPVGARGDRHGEAARVRAAGGRGDRAADAREVAQGAEPVEVLGAGAQTGERDVHRVALRAVRGDGARPDDLAEALVRGHLVLHPERLVRHAAEAVEREGVHGQAGPQDHAVGPRVARGDAERERRGAGGRVGGAGRRGQQRRGGDDEARPAEEGAAGDGVGGRVRGISVRGHPCRVAGAGDADVTGR